MKRILFSAAVCAMLCACGQHSEPGSSADRTTAQDTGFTRPIDIDTANRMITSYLDGINYKVNTDEIMSLIVDADSIRAYLDQKANGNTNKITKLKFVFAHTLDYIHSGHEGLRPDSNSHALTFIIVGYDKDGKYVYTRQGMAFDFAQPCPPRCPVGDAGSNLLLHYQN